MMAINIQFLLDLDGLHAWDHHYIDQGLDHLHSLPPAYKKAWLRGIQLARETCLASKAKEMESMRSLMLDWLSS
jgi:hypothetical protein